MYYIKRKSLNKKEIKGVLCGMMELLDILNGTRRDCLTALNLPMSDYEEAVLSCCSKNWETENIITRNTKTFSLSLSKALIAEQFLQLF